MSKKLWIAHETHARTFICRVSIEGCEYVADFLQEIKKESLLSIPQNTPINLYKSDGTTEIDVGDSPDDYLKGNTRRQPLIVRTVKVTAMDFPAFDPSNYKFEFPFFEDTNGENEIDILGRDDVIREINSIMCNRLNYNKYWPVVISTSRGMGKTFLLKKFGSQQIKSDLKTPIIGEAIACGRILSFDFAKHPNAIQNDDDVYSFFPRLMIYFLCRMFGGTQVDGINFQKIHTLDEVNSFIGKQDRFNEWLVKWRLSNSEALMLEYIRLTNIAFGTTYNCPPVFLLDEIQKLCHSTNVQSLFSMDGTSVKHSQLSLLLTQLAGKLKPVCICTGTNSGKIASITDKSAIIPKVLSLRPLIYEYKEFWKQLTAYKFSQYSVMEIDHDEDLIDVLAYSSYQVPRLLFLAHCVWFELRESGSTKNYEFYIQKFVEIAVQYYGEMVQVLKELSTEDIAHIILSCGVHWLVHDENEHVPGTNIAWAHLIQMSLVFPYVDKCFIFPFSLVWRVGVSHDASKKKAKIEDKCAKLVPNLDVKDLFISYDVLCKWEYNEIGVGYETLFVSSLAVKYYLHSIFYTGEGGYLDFPMLYDFDPSESPAYDFMKNFKVNISGGISLPSEEVFADSSDLGLVIIHNKNIQKAHHDVILPACTKSGPVNIAVQAKSSFDVPVEEEIDRQLIVHPHSEEKVKRLFWLYLGECPKEKKFNSVAFLNGSGCCNGLALNSYILSKKLKG